MTLSIIIVNYNVEHFLHQCLKSIEKAKQNIILEIIIVDNNSVDQSIKMLKKHFSYVKIIQNTQNVGFAKANNQAIREASGEYILLLNPDTIIQENTLLKTIQYLKDHQDVGALGVKMIDGNGEFLPESKRSLPNPMSAFYKIFGFSKVFPKSKKFGEYHLNYLDENIIHKIDVVSGAFFMTRSKIFQKIGMLDERFFMYGEDIDLSYRIQKSGYKNIYFPNTSIIHYKGESTKKTSVNYIIIFYNAMLLFVKKHYTKHEARPLIIAIKLAILIRASISIIKQFALKIIQPVIDAITILSGMYILKDIWATQYFLDEDYYNNTFLIYMIPIYTIVWLFGIYLQNGYKKPIKPLNTIKGVFLGSLILLIIYGLLPETLRFSRALILLGAIWSITTLTIIRYILSLSNIHVFKIQSLNNKKIGVIAQKNEFNRIKKIIEQTTIDYMSVSKIDIDKESNHSLGHIQQITEIIKIHQINEIIFSAKDVNANQIMRYMSLINRKVNIKIAPSESTFIIGSNSVHRKGDLYVVRNNKDKKNSIKKFFKKNIDFFN